MKPRNKFQTNIVAQSKSLPKITPTQRAWAEKHLFNHFARVTKGGKVTCLECGGEWHDKGLVPPTPLYDALITETTRCPHCNTKLNIKLSIKQKFEQMEYLCIPTTHKGFQVVRFVEINAKYEVRKPARYFHREVVQHWIAPDGKFATFALQRCLNYWYNYSWLSNSELELRPYNNFYNATPSGVYPRMRVLPQLKRNGFKGEFHNLTPLDLFHSLLISNRAETLYKIGQIELFRHFVKRGMNDIEKYWASIKIAVRNNYTITDGTTWCDYIDLLQHFGKDTNSPKYVCPTNLTSQHDQLVKRREEQRAQERAEKDRLNALKEEDKFKELKAKFFGLMFSDGALQVRVLESVLEHIEEGRVMHHCVGSYHSKAKSLILSATIDGARVATIEISLDTLQVVQCRGVCNEQVAEQPQIIDLVNRNVEQIQQRLTA
ncbi:MAG: PcfJ domain-containing protein [Rikenellaceae bacterium]